MWKLENMKVGKIYYRRIEGTKCIIQGFFYLHYDNSRSSISLSLEKLIKAVYSNKLQSENIHVLFHDSTFDTVDNLFTNLYMTEVEYKKMREYTQDDYESQHAEEKVLWNESDLVPNPK